MPAIGFRFDKNSTDIGPILSNLFGDFKSLCYAYCKREGGLFVCVFSPPLPAQEGLGVPIGQKGVCETHGQVNGLIGQIQLLF